MKLGEIVRTSKSVGFSHLLDGGRDMPGREVNSNSGLCVGQPCWFPPRTQELPEDHSVSGGSVRKEMRTRFRTR